MIAIDVGNTSIHIAHFKKDKLQHARKIPTLGVTKTSLKNNLKVEPNEKNFSMLGCTKSYRNI